MQCGKRVLGSGSWSSASGFMRTEPNAQEVLAIDYCHPVRHPNCANLRDCSDLLMRTWLAQPGVDDLICEVDCGTSLAAELLTTIVARGGYG
jgi:hypothetical protein